MLHIDVTVSWPEVLVLILVGGIVSAIGKASAESLIGAVSRHRKRRNG